MQPPRALFCAPARHWSRRAGSSHNLSLKISKEEGAYSIKEVPAQTNELLREFSQPSHQI